MQINRTLAVLVTTLLLASFDALPWAAAETATTGPPYGATSWTAGSFTPRDEQRYLALRPADRAEFDRILASPAATDPTLTQADASRISVRLKISLESGTDKLSPPTGRVTRSRAPIAAMFSLYEVHSWYSHTASFLGISYNTARIDYYYVTGNGIVQSDHYCDASDSGFTGGYSVSWYANHYVSGGYGHCIATYIQSAYGVVVDTLHQGMTVSGSRVVSTYGPS